MALPSANFPTSVWDGNEQDTTNDPASEDTTLAEARDWNESAAEVIEVMRLLRGKVTAGHAGAIAPAVNRSGGALSMATPFMVQIDDYDEPTGLPQMIAAGGGTSSYQKLIGLLVMEKGGDRDSVADDAIGYVLQEGVAGKLNTNAWGAGTYLWLANAGALSATPIAGAPPTAVVLITSATDGVLRVFSHGLGSLHIQHLSGMLNSILSPAQITANEDDYNPTGLQTAGLLRLNSDAARDITGITAPTIHEPGRELKITNINAAFLLTLKDEDANSAAANRMALGADIDLGHDGGVTLVYDSVSSRWRPAGSCDGNGGLIKGIGPELTISTGAITPTHAFHTIDTEGDAANDDFITINGVNALPGDTLILQQADAARDPRAVNGTDNIITRTGVNQTLNNAGQRLEFHFDGTYWTCDKYTG